MVAIGTLPVSEYGGPAGDVTGSHEKLVGRLC